MFYKKHFTLPQTQNLLPDLKPKLLKIINLKKILDEKGYDIYKHHFFGGLGTNGTGKYPQDLESLIELVNQITKDGIILKGINEGLIDFPHIRNNGEEVFLCYLYGEEKILFWHRIQEGFAGRQNLDSL